MIAPRWRKVIRDLWSNKTKTILVVLAIAVGLFASGSVFITQNVLVLDMNSQYRAANPSSIIMATASPFDSSLVRWLGQQPQVVQAQGRSVRNVTLLVGQETYNLTLYGYDNINSIAMNRITPETGVWPPGRHAITFERRSIGLSRAGLGDTVTVEMSDGQRHELTVAGTVHDVSVFPANMFPMPSGYVSLNTMEWLGLTDTLNEIDIVARPENTTLPQLEGVASELKQKLQERGVTVRSVLVRQPDDHWAKEVTQSFTLILSGIGIFSLIMSAFLVVNTVTAMLAQQRRQIGVMKAVGGTRRQVISLYLVLVAFYGVLALFVALPMSLVMGYAFTAMVANMLNINIQNFHMPWSVFFMELGAAVLLPVLAAAIPVLGGVRVPVRVTLSNQGIGGSGRGGWFDRLLLRVRLLSRPTLLSLRNTFRRKARLAMTLGTLILAGTLFISIMGVRASLVVNLSDTFKKYYDWEVALYLDGSYPERAVESRAERTAGVVAVESQNSILAQPIKPDGTRGASFNLLGVSPGSRFLNPDPVSGRWLRRGDRNDVVLTSGLAKDMPGVRVGDRIRLAMGNSEYDWNVIGIIPMVWDKVGYTDFSYLSRLKGTAGQASQLYVSTSRTDVQFQTDMGKVLEDQLKKSGVKVGGSMTRSTIASSLSSRDAFLVSFLLIMAVMCAVIGGLGLMGLMSLNVLERTREIGVMRSIGASSGSVGGIVVSEGLLIGLLSWLLAIPLSVPMSLLFDRALGEIVAGQPLAFVFSWVGLLGWLVVVSIISVLASLLPAYRAMKMSVRETLAYE